MRGPEDMPATKDQIADTFARHVERFGLSRASVEDVASELGISKRTIYQHFSSKRELYGYVVGRIAEGERDRLAALVADGPSWSERTERFLWIVISGMRQHIQETTKADWLQEFEVAVDAMTAAYGAVAVELIRGGYEAGEFRFADAELANGLIGAMVTYYGTVVREHRDFDADEAVVAAIMRMLGCPGAAGRDEE